ncbi:bifunctional nuclease family protein [Micrococcus sp.]|uniref:bifunctional nuclease family protein n=1 Tax=Micrococcus sp. TaxID=1271 RepID=UPI002A911515|nr:bifunctional nuclease family protein [Micrococcus sp.]MDY6055584.1 bifunctional nuclease family protein [Micrococcus sp.]
MSAAGGGIPLTVLGVRVELPEQRHVVLLLDPSGRTVVPVWVGAAEATAVALALEGVVPPRPLTHDLALSALRAAGEDLVAVRLTGVVDDVVHAALVLRGGAEVDARASDAVALALRAEAPVLASEAVLAEAGMPAADEDDRAVDDFRRFLDTVDPEDFA